MLLPVTNTMDRPVTIQADEVLTRLFSPHPILNIKEAQNVQYQSTMCSTQKDKEKEDLINKFSMIVVDRHNGHNTPFKISIFHKRTT